MAALTPKQEAFAQAVASGKNQSDAYRAAYVADKMKATSVNVNASKLMSDAKVAQRVAELRGELAKKALWTREMSVKALVRVYAATDTPSAVKVSAVKELNAMHGYNAPARVDHTSSDGSMTPKSAEIDVSKISTDALAELVDAARGD